MEAWLQGFQGLAAGEPYLRLSDGEAVFFYFVLYSIAGWLLENTYNWLLGGGFWKPGFLQGPYKPMYGFAPLILLMVTGKETSLWVLGVLCFFVPTVVEYVSGWLMDRLFHKKYWDYSNFQYQIHSYICLPYSLCWLGLSLLMVYGLHPFIASVYKAFAGIWHWGWEAVALWLLFDAAWTVRAYLRHGSLAGNRLP